MNLISQLTQSRLSILLFDKTTNVLLNKIPVYAEISITVRLPPYTIDQALEIKDRTIRLWFSQHKDIINLINNVITGNVAENDFNSIPDKQQLYMAILEKLKDNMDDSETEEQKQLLITEIVMQVLRKLEISTSSQSNMQTLYSFPLGTLASDHVGYLSYDLTHVASKLQSMVQGTLFQGSILQEGGIVREDLFQASNISIFAYPLGRDDLKIDVWLQGRFTSEVIFAKLPIEIPGEFDEFKKANLPSMQNPGLEDWYLSPGSFARNPAFFIGTDGCENLYPANFATHEFSFFQIIRGNNILIRPVEDKPETKDKDETVLEVRTGWSLEYLVSWQPLGHTLGQIVYSLPLAPGEIVKIAVIDWARKSIDSRNEDLTVKEQLTHNTHRDRNISETVDAAMQEWQRGGSFMGGVAGSYGGAGFGISGALGGGYSTSSGDRNVHASTVQQISDAFAQASSSVRELRSTIVIQSDQQERAKAETRVVANHNHSHALTMLYYEVLRHYKVATQFMRVRPSLLVQYAHIDFRNIHNIIQHRKTLESVLIEGRYLGCFDAVSKLQCFTTEFERKKHRQH
ncbi:MAG: flagellar basal body-associated FliL family protein [Flavitalea sp.]